jgi:dTDP-4-dehydrorhamnose reductase
VTLDQRSILFTGGSGLLGQTIQRILPDAHYPASSECDVRNFEQLDALVAALRPSTLVHAAALTSPPRVDKNPELALDVNIIGTANVVKACIKHRLKLVYISTDYVFRGDQGSYAEEDAVYPVNNYAWSKLGGECAVRFHANSLIVRTSFGPDEFPFPKAMTDQWTSRESVSQIAAKLVALLGSDAVGVVHVGGGRRSVWEYARSLDQGQKEIAQISIHDLPFKVPADTSLRCDRYEQIIRQLEGLDGATPKRE